MSLAPEGSCCPSRRFCYGCYDFGLVFSGGGGAPYLQQIWLVAGLEVTVMILLVA